METLALTIWQNDLLDIPYLFLRFMQYLKIGSVVIKEAHHNFVLVEGETWAINALINC